MASFSHFRGQIGSTFQRILPQLELSSEGSGIDPDDPEADPE